MLSLQSLDSVKTTEAGITKTARRVSASTQAPEFTTPFTTHATVFIVFENRSRKQKTLTKRGKIV